MSLGTTGTVVAWETKGIGERRDKSNRIAEGRALSPVPLGVISTERLRAVLNDADDTKVAQRLVVAGACTDGGCVETITEPYGIPQSTIYYSLDRLEKQPLAEALRDEPWPGRPP